VELTDGAKVSSKVGLVVGDWLREGLCEGESDGGPEGTRLGSDDGWRVLNIVVIVEVFSDTGTESALARLEAKELLDIAVEMVDANDVADDEGDEVNIANETDQLELDKCRVVAAIVV